MVNIPFFPIYACCFLLYLYYRYTQYPELERGLRAVQMHLYVLRPTMYVIPDTISP
jgi:hypothetical protein